jgi:transposase
MAIDTSKHVFTSHGVNERGEVGLTRELGRQQVDQFLAKLSRQMWCWKRAAARIIGATRWRHWGHRVRLIAPQYVKPLMKRGKNDRADAAAISEAAGGRR